MNFATTLDEVLYLRSENERLQGVKRRSLAIADERAIEAVKTRAENEKLRAALMWVFNRMSLAVGSSEGMTAKEQRDTHREVGHALMGRTSRATKHKPNDWDPSAELMRADQQTGADTK